MGATFERLLVAVVAAIALGAFAIGCYFAVTRNDSQWVNRAGALIVSVEALLLFAELSRRARLREVEEKYGDENPYVGKEIRRAERRLVTITATMIALGEFLHGFGDLLFDLVRSLA
jgi:hypothetical protein